MKHKVGVVVVTYNSESELEKCLKSILEQNSRELETFTVVVDNNSKDKSTDIASRLKVKTVKNNRNLGFSKAVNKGLREAFSKGCNYILILNPDAILMKHSLKNLLTCLDQEENVAAVGPLMLHSDGTPSNEGYYLKAPSALTVTFFSTFLRPWALKQSFLRRHYEETLQASEKSEVEQIPGACLLTTKKVIDEIGPLDEDFAIWFEDVEWSYRARKHGYRLMFCPEAEVIHEGGVSFAKWEGLEKAVTFYVSMKTFFNKHKPFSGLFIRLALAVNSTALFVKSGDRSNLVFLKRFLLEKKGKLPR